MLEVSILWKLPWKVNATVMAYIFDVGVTWRVLCGLPSEKNGELSCFPHLILRMHSTESNIIAYQGEKTARLQWVFVWAQLGLRRLQLSRRIVEHWYVQSYMLGTSPLPFSIIYSSLVKEKCGAFEWHNRQLHVMRYNRLKKKWPKKKRIFH